MSEPAGRAPGGPLPGRSASGTMTVSKGGVAVDEVRYLLLGPMELHVGGQPVLLPGPAERALLAQLLLAPRRTVPATTLVDRLWSGSSLPVDPLNALQVRVSKLRRALTAVGLRDVVARQGTGYRADVDPETVDTVAFAARIARVRTAAASALHPDEEHLAAYDEALVLWRGDPLSDFVHEPWAAVESGRLAELHLASLTERAQIALGLGHASEVVADLEPLVAADPTLESLAGLLMVALYRAGRQTEALEVYQRTRTVLDEALGLEASVSLRSLHERILRQDASLGGQPDLVPPVVAAPRQRTARAPRVAATSLPVVARPLLGRQEQLGTLRELLGEARLLTLVGPGGAGKTSLALGVAAGAAESFPDGVHGVRLASIRSADQVPWAVAEAVGVPLDGAAAERDVRDRLFAFLGHRRSLVLLDNCEHVVDAAASLADDLLARCPHVTVLATSREALAVRDEVQVTVGPLETPPADVPPEQVIDHAAAQLFVQRARALAPTAVSSEEDLSAVGTIVRALDGLPLAIELAAARVTSLSPVEIAARLGQRFTLLTSGNRTADERQRTLRAAVDWSYDLLDVDERRIFDQLSVFQGGWTLEAAEAVLDGGDVSRGEVLDVVGRLVERSMVVVERGATTRYRMLETLRDYSAERLEAEGGTGTLRGRHAAHYKHVAQECERLLRSGAQRAALAVLRDEQPNIRAALAWWAGPDGDRDAALEMAGSLGLFWHLGRHLEGREVLAGLLDSQTGSPAARARALQALSLVERPRACLVHPSPTCAAAAAESLAGFEEVGDASRAALSKVLLAVEGVSGSPPAGDRERFARLLEEAAAQFATNDDEWGAAVIGFVRMETLLKRGDEAAVRVGRATATAFRRIDDPWGLSATLYHLGWGLRQFGRFEDAARALEEAIDVAAAAGLWNTVQWALADLGVTQLDVGRHQSAEELFRRAADASRRVGDGAGAVLCDYGIGLLSQLRNDWDTARDHFERAVTGFERLGTPVMRGLAVLGVARCDERGGALALAQDAYEEALALGRSTGEPGLTASGLEGLARLARAAGDREAGRRLAADADRERFTGNRPLPPHERAEASPARNAAG